MIVPDESADSAALAARSAKQLARGISATWWYTASAIVGFELMVIFIWTVALAGGGGLPAGAVVALAVGGLVWVASTVLLLSDYRHRADTNRLAAWRRVIAPLVVALALGAVAGWMTGFWLITLVPLAQTVTLLNWAPGIRSRVVLTATLILGAVWAIDSAIVFGDQARSLPQAALVGYISILLPVMSVLSLWWWDVLIALDRARASEARLAATQERLRVATDVHDLQGHHLQVIALQLELAERLLPTDPAAALIQLKASRTSVDDARQGTRDLALRFRSVPLRDEIDNAADLLRSAGARVEARTGGDVDLAPAGVLGPVIRETTTNVLRHGGGDWARLSLARQEAGWRYEISNDSGPQGPGDEGGAGLAGLARRAKDAGGTLQVSHDDGVFSVVMTVPDVEKAS